MLNFLNYINPHYLFYSITIITFASLFFLVWILKCYSFFDKINIKTTSSTTFPYGDFGDVIKNEMSIHLFFWKQFATFKRKKCKYAGLYLLQKPVLLLVDPDDITLKISEPSLSDQQFSTKSFKEKFNYYIKNALEADNYLILKEILLESNSILFGVNSSKPIQELLKVKYEINFKYFLRLQHPFLNGFYANDNSDLWQNLQQTLKSDIEDLNKSRNKIEKEKSDNIIEAFYKLYHQDKENSFEKTTKEFFNLYADVLTYSYSSLNFCLWELAENEDIQEEVIGEIRRSGNGKGDLVYLNAVIKETLRKYPPMASLIIQSDDESPLMNWFPGKNRILCKSILGIHRDPLNYAQPETFDPDRFLENVPDETIFQPFDGEANKFLMKLVMLQMEVILLAIFSNFKVGFDFGKVKPVKPFKFDCQLLYLSAKEEIPFKFKKINS